MLSLFVLLYVLIIAIFKTIVFFICAISVFFDNMLNKIKSNQIKFNINQSCNNFLMPLSLEYVSYLTLSKVNLYFRTVFLADNPNLSLRSLRFTKRVENNFLPACPRTQTRWRQQLKLTILTYSSMIQSPALVHMI